MAESRYDVFVSYSRPEAEVVEQLSRILQDAGLCVWLDTWELVPGASWRDLIEEAMRSSSATIVCIGRAGVTQWQRAEYQAALQVETIDESKPVIPVLLPGAEPEAVPAFLRARSWVDLRSGLDNRRELERLLAAVESAGKGSEITREERPGDSLLEVGDPRMAVEHYERREPRTVTSTQRWRLRSATLRMFWQQLEPRVPRLARTTKLTTCSYESTDQTTALPRLFATTWRRPRLVFRSAPNNSMQRTALRATADAGRSASG